MAFCAILAGVSGCDPAPPEGKTISGKEYNDLANSTLTEEDKKIQAENMAQRNAEGGRGR